MRARKVTFSANDRCLFTQACPAQLQSRPNARWACAQFQQLDQIGSGHGSVVHLVWDKATHVYLAVKCYKGAALRLDTAKQICHEVQMHAELDHPNILPLYGAFIEDDDIFLVMPYAHQGSVYHLLRQHSLQEHELVTSIVLPFLAGLQHLHSMGYLHRDIKTENVLVDESGRVLIADFGLAIDTTTSPAVHCVGTPVYMAPEVFGMQSGAHAATLSASAAHAAASPKPQSTTAPSEHPGKCTSEARDSTYCDKADCWSAAVFIYEVLCGRSPFGHIRDRQALERAVLRAPIPTPSSISELAAQFLSAALDRTPQTRLSVTDMLAHPWLAAAADAAAAEQRDTLLLACKEPFVLPAVPAASSAPGNNAPCGNPFLSERNDSTPHTVIGFAAPCDASETDHAHTAAAAPSSLSKGAHMPPPVHAQEDESQSTTTASSEQSSVYVDAPAEGPPAAAKRAHATFDIAVSTFTRTPRASDVLRKCASASNCSMKRDQKVTCNTLRPRTSTSTSAIPTMPTSSLTQALVALNGSPNNYSSSPSNGSTDYAHSPTSSALRSDCVTPVLLEGGHDGHHRSLTRSTSGGGAAPVARVTIVYATGEQSRTCSPVGGTVGTLPCITEAAIEREAVEPNRSTHKTTQPCTKTVCLNPAVCAPAGRCTGGSAPHIWNGDDATDKNGRDVPPTKAPDAQQVPSASSVEPVKASGMTCNNLVSAALKPVATAVAVSTHGRSHELESSDQVCGSSVDDDRTFDVRGSWGGSIDSTAGAAVARMMDHFGSRDVMHAPIDPGHCGSMASSHTVSYESGEATMLNSCLCHSSCAECCDLSVTAEEEDPIDESASFSHSCVEKETHACVAACAQLQPASCTNAEDKACALGLMPATEQSAEAISIRPQHLVVQEHATHTGSLAIPEIRLSSDMGSGASSSIATGSVVSSDKPASLQHQRSAAMGHAFGVCIAGATTEGTAQTANPPLSYRLCTLHGGALERSLSGKGANKEAAAHAWRGADSTQSLHVLVEDTPSQCSHQEQISVLQASPPV